MKKLFLSLSLSVIFLNSCTTRVVSAEKSYSDDKILQGRTYTFISKDGKKESINITKIDEQNIYGNDSEGKKVVIEKSNISEVKKTKVGATIGLVAGIIALVIIAPAYYKNEPIGGR